MQKTLKNSLTYASLLSGRNCAQMGVNDSSLSIEPSQKEVIEVIETEKETVSISYESSNIL